LSDVTIERARNWPVEDIPERLGYGSVPPGHLVSSPLRRDAVPSLQVGGARNVFYDHGTGEMFDSIAFTRKMLGCGFRQAVEWIEAQSE
jgi:hypothetical protein